MNLTSLNTISPIDGRYRNKVVKRSEFFSEEALIKYRVKVEVEYFIALCEIPLSQLQDFNKNNFEKLRAIYLDFSTSDTLKIYKIERNSQLKGL
jgi:adenylosuccinate lyase